MKKWTSVVLLLMTMATGVAALGAGAAGTFPSAVSAALAPTDAGADATSLARPLAPIACPQGPPIGPNQCIDILTACSNGSPTACSAPADNTGTGLIFLGGGFATWKDVLALLYGGLDPVSKVTDCGSTKRKALVANFGNLFQPNQAACGYMNTNTTCTTARFASTATTPLVGQTFTVNGALWHAYRPDDSSTIAATFANLIGLKAITDLNGAFVLNARPSAVAVNNFGTSPYCNAMNWDTVDNPAGSGCVDPATGNLKVGQQFIGPGGVPQGFCTNGIACRPAGALANANVCNNGSSCAPAGSRCADGSVCVRVCSNGSACTADPKFRRPPLNTWGDVPNPTESVNSIGADVLPTSFQDNDPIRSNCIGQDFLGNPPFNQAGSDPTEEVCNIDGTLGLVLPIPDVTFIAAPLTAYPVTECTAFVPGLMIPVAQCAPDAINNNVCPDGAHDIVGSCQIPVTGLPANTHTPQCENNPSHWPFRDPIQKDGRIFNLAVFTAVGGLHPVTRFANPFLGAFGRIHQTYPLWDANNDTVPAPNVPCTQAGDVPQVGCLVQADPCSVGVEDDLAKGWGGGGVDALRVNQIYPCDPGYPLP